MQKTRIMVVEDEAIIAEDLKRTIADLGYEVACTASSADEAIHNAAEMKPDLILMDIMLRGEKDGITAAHDIRKQMDTPIIFLTAYSDSALINRATMTQPYAYIIKPFQPRQLLASIEMTLYRSHTEKQLRYTQKWLATTLKSIGDAVISVDTTGIVTYMNPVAEKLTGWNYKTAEHATIEQVFDLIDELTGDRIENVFERVMRTPTDIIELPDQTALITRDGSTVPIEDCCTPIKSDEGEVIGAVVVFREVTRPITD